MFVHAVRLAALRHCESRVTDSMAALRHCESRVFLFKRSMRSPADALHCTLLYRICILLCIELQCSFGMAFVIYSVRIHILLCIELQCTLLDGILISFCIELKCTLLFCAWICFVSSCSVHCCMVWHLHCIAYRSTVYAFAFYCVSSCALHCCMALAFYCVSTCSVH